MVSDLRKGDLLYYADRGIVGTFYKADATGTEQGYVDITFYPLKNGFSFGKGKASVIRNVPHDAQHVISNQWNDMGAQKRIYFIFTDEPGSIVRTIFNTTNQQKINELKETNASLRKQVASLKQQANDASSGANKYIESVKSVNKAGRPSFSDLVPPRPPYGGGYDRGPGGFPDIEGDY